MIFLSGPQHQQPTVSRHPRLLLGHEANYSRAAVQRQPLGAAYPPAHTSHVEGPVHILHDLVCQLLNEVYRAQTQLNDDVVKA